MGGNILILYIGISLRRGKIETEHGPKSYDRFLNNDIIYFDYGYKHSYLH